MKSFNTYINDNSATGDQQRLAQTLDEFFRSENQAFLMMGGAGTGKTHMLKMLVAHLKVTNQNFRLMAPTGRAAKVLSERTGAPASTMHRAIYRMDKLHEYKVTDQDGSETYKFYFELASNSEPVDTIYIVDEASMVSDCYAEEEFYRFGSGYLLKDFVTHAGCGLPGRRHKIIFCGDPAQLPPVGDNNSPALCADTLKKKYNLVTMAFEMEEVVRQKADSGILKNASCLRRQIRLNELTCFGIETAPDITLQESGSLVAPWQAACDRDSLEQTIIVAWSNTQVYDFNNIIREHLYGAPAPTVCTGDRILVVRNNYTQQIPLMNGEFGYVVRASTEVECKTVFINKPIDGKRNNVAVELAFRQVTLRFEHPDGGRVEVDCLINDILLNNREPKPTSDECKALYVDFKNRHGKLKPHTAEFREALCTDPYFNCLHIKFGYAVTAHKAQGGEWRNAFVDFSRGKQSVYKQDYFRWAYTAMTRASQRLFVMNAPQFTRLTAVHGVDEPTIEALVPLLMSPTGVSTVPLPVSMPEDQPWLAALYHALDAFAKPLGITLSGVRHLPYNEAYTLKLDEMTCGIFNIHYNNQQRITCIYPAPGNPPAFAPILEECERLLKGKRMIVVPAEEAEKSAPQVQGTLLPHHEQFCDVLQQALSGGEGRMVAITVNGPYHLTCSFADKTGDACLHYYFNKREQLTKVTPQSGKSTSATLLASVLAMSKKQGAMP